MHSLEPEYLELRADGEIDAAAAARAVVLERGTTFCVFRELRFALYGSVAAITSGIAILLAKNLDRIGPITVILALAAVAAGCYGAAIRTRIRGETRSLGGDYLLLLGALILSADVGYAESQFHWLGSRWSWHLLILAALHGATAYVLDSRLVLSASLATLAGWFGVEGNWSAVLHTDGTPGRPGIQAIVYGGVVLAWREVHRHLRGNPAFLYVFENFAANAGFCGALALCFAMETRLVGLVVLVSFALASIRKALRGNQEIFLIYGICYASLGLCSVEAQVFPFGLFAALIELATVVAGVTLLWFFHQRLKAVTA
ncbi:MAG: DUF2157 domain-containing protein [Steroidobacteraceae bacterium]